MGFIFGLLLKVDVQKRKLESTGFGRGPAQRDKALVVVARHGSMPRHPLRVRFGPLAGCEGILTRKKGLSRLVLSVNLLQQSVIAEVDADSIEPA